MSRHYICLLFALALLQLSSCALPAAIKAQEIEDIGGFVLFRITPTNKFEFLLVEKASEPGDWSPPKGHVEKGETAFEAAYRELREETSILSGEVAPLFEYPVYFEYETNKDVLKRVTLWPAQLNDYDHPIIISEESRAYTWAETGRALEIVKKQYKEAFFKIVQGIDCHFNLELC